MLTVRLAEHGDSENLWQWRNDAQTMAASGDPTPVPWSEHEAWFANVLANPSRTILIAVDKDSTAVGMVRFDVGGDQRVTVSINLAPSHRGQGLGRVVLHEAVAWFRVHRPPAILVAIVRSENVASRKVFVEEGFAIESETQGFLELSRAI